MLLQVHSFQVHDDEGEDATGIIRCNQKIGVYSTYIKESEIEKKFAYILN